MFCMLEKEIYILHMYQNINSEKQVIILMISNEKGRWHYVAVKNYRDYYEE